MKVPTCKCHEKLSPAGAEHELKSARIGYCVLPEKVNVKFNGNIVEVITTRTYHEIQMELNFCPQCGAEYREQDSADKGDV